MANPYRSDDALGELAAPDRLDSPFESAAARLRSRYGRLPAGDADTTGFIGPDIADAGRSFFPGVVAGAVNTAARGGQAAALEMGDISPQPTPEEAMAAIQANVTGPLYQPRTVGGRMSHAVGEIAGNPANWLGPGSMAYKSGFNVLSGLGAQLAGEATAGTPAEPVARALGSWGPAFAERALPQLYKMVPEGVGALGGRQIQPTLPKPGVRPGGGDYGDLMPGSQEWRDAPNPAALYPQYAAEYPPVGPPLMQPKDKPSYPGEMYAAKRPTPEAAAFAKNRQAIIKDMEANDYPRYFDPEQRFSVDPAHYPLNVDTRTLLPKTPEVVARNLDKVGTPQMRANLQDAYAKGVALGGDGPRSTTADWYQMGQLEKELTDALGPQAGRAAFRENLATPMAATTGGMNPQSNLIAAGYYNYLRSRGEPWPLPNQWPTPVGAQYGEQLGATAQKIADAGGFAGLGGANPKRHNFAADFMGHTDRPTLDEQMTKVMEPGKTSPTWYGVNEAILAQEAAKAGVSPVRFQEVGWHGIKNTSGTPFIDTVNAAIERNHRLTGMPRAEFVRRAFGTGDIPIYGLGAAAGMGALAAPREDRP